jgi:hypothetical protein
MSLALPASIEISAEPLISQDIKPSGARASWEVWRIDDKVDDAMRESRTSAVGNGHLAMIMTPRSNAAH